MVVGAGGLGRRVAKLWKIYEGSEAPVYAVTRYPDEERDATLRADGINPILRADLSSMPLIPNVVFCAPPGIKFDAASLLLYPGTISSALGKWDHQAENASFVFTSSAGVYAEQNGGVVTEESPAAETIRAERLLAAERLVAECGGTVLRLAGLYDMNRGAHQIYLGRPRWPADPVGLINQLHYGMCVCVCGCRAAYCSSFVSLATHSASLTSVHASSHALSLSLFLSLTVLSRVSL